MGFVERRRVRLIRMDDEDIDGSELYIGHLPHRPKDELVGILHGDRAQHCWICGKSGTGKSTLLRNMFLQDLWLSHSAGIIDPHGSLIDQVLPMIPTNRINDVVYFNPADEAFPVAFNPLDIPDPKSRGTAVAGIVSIFMKVWPDGWSARMERLLINALLALSETPGTHLVDLVRFLADETYRNTLTAHVANPEVKAYWRGEFSSMPKNYQLEAVAAVLNKAQQLTVSPLMRNILGQSRSKINVRTIMDEGKILLVDLATGLLGERNAELLGSMLVTAIQLAAMGRIETLKAGKTPRNFYLYIDEFQHYSTDSFATILAEARKMGLSLTISHQFISQLTQTRSTLIRDAIFGNVGSMIVLRIGPKDINFLKQEFAYDNLQEEFLELENYQAIVKLNTLGMTSRPFKVQLSEPLFFSQGERVKEKIIRASRERYGTRRRIVEAALGTRYPDYGQ